MKKEDIEDFINPNPLSIIKMMSLGESLKNDVRIQRDELGWVINGIGFNDNEIASYLSDILTFYPTRQILNQVIVCLWEIGGYIKDEICDGLVSSLEHETSEERIAFLKRHDFDIHYNDFGHIAWLLGKFHAKQAEKLLKKLVMKEDDIDLKFEYARALARIQLDLNGEGMVTLKQQLDNKEWEKWFEAIKNLEFEIQYKIQTAETGESTHYSTIEIKSKSVFISYTDEEIHKEWLNKLISKLKLSNISVHYYDDDVAYGESITKFMNRIEKADYTLLILTKKYCEKIETEGSGVEYELDLVDEMKRRNIPERKVIPVLREDDCKEILPFRISRRKHLNMSDDRKFEVKFQELIDHIFEKK